MTIRQSTRAQVHETAIIDPDAHLGDGVSVGPYSIIGPHVRLGDGCEIRSHVLIEGHTTLGRRNRVFHGAAIGSPPQDFSYKGEESYLVIGDGNVIREYVTIQPGASAGATTKVGSENLLMAYVHVAHDCTLGDRIVLANAVNLAGHVRIEDHAVVGGVTPVHQFVRIGCHAIVGGGSRVPMDVAPYVKVAGIPPRTYGLNTIGLSRRGFTPETIAALKKAYRIYFREKLTGEEATTRIEREVPDLAEVRRFVAFARQEGRGIIR